MTDCAKNKELKTDDDSLENTKVGNLADYIGKVAEFMKLTTLILKIVLKLVKPMLELCNILSIKKMNLKLEDSVCKLGPRYTPELHVNMSIEDDFKMLSKDEESLDCMFPYFKDFVEKSAEICGIGDSQYDDIVNEFHQKVEEMKEFYFYCEKNRRKKILLHDLLGKIKNVKTVVENFYSRNQDLKKENNLNEKSKQYKDQVRYNERRMYDVEERLQKLQDFFLKNAGRFLEKQAMLLVGKAGSGKSHLLADVAKKRIQYKKWTCLFLGNTFKKGDLWKQFLEKLSVKYGKKFFLYVLNKYSWMRGFRSLIFIDALNECDCTDFWKQNLKLFLKDIQKYSNIGVVLSVRSEYKDYLLSKEIQSLLSVVEHKGFDGVEFDAINRYFKCYNINLPNTPLLNPEFSNPLFLKLFCEMIKNKGLHEMPSGFCNLLEIFRNYIDDLNERISRKYNVLPSLNLIRKSIEHIALEMLNQEKGLLFSDDVLKTVNLALCNSGIRPADLYADFVSEGIIVQIFDEEKNAKIYFAYERYYDLLVAKALIGTEKNPKKIRDMFKENGPLYKFVVTEFDFSDYQGLWNAWSILLPDDCEIEIFDVVPEKCLSSVKEAFLDGLLWRKKINIETIRDYVNNEILPFDYFFSKWLDTWLLLCAKVDCPLNGDYLHNKLFPLSMGVRDAEWSIYISTQSDDENNYVSRIIDWAWHNEDLKSLSDESIRLLGQTLVWFFTSMNRIVRDTASTALVNLLKNKLNVLICLLDKFKDVNDPYVLQRLYAVAFGCAANCFDRNGLKLLCESVYKNIFYHTNVVSDILLRDYAMNTIDYAVQLGISFDFDVSKIYPPYRSSMPNQLPLNDVVDANKVPHENGNYDSPKYSINKIMQSMTTEYGRGTSHYGDFGRYVWDSAFACWNVDTNLLSNYAVMWILNQSGFDYNIHGEFDMSISHGERFGNICERIGKKYQWIAYFDLLGRVSDNCQMKEGVYEGSFEPFVRDFDPTTIKKSIYHADEKYYSHFLKKFHWNQKNKKWILKKNNYPAIENFLLEKDAENIEWLVLERPIHLKQPEKLNGTFGAKKDFFCSISSYVISDNDFDSFKTWAKNQNFYDQHLPECHECYKIFFREYYWSKAFKSEYKDYDWSTIVDSLKKDVAVVSKTTYNYFWENEYDHSKEGVFSFAIPSKEICELMKLRHGSRDGEFINESGIVVCKNPAVNEKHPSCLMVRKDEFLKALKEKGLKIVWTVLGEKRIASLKNEDRYDWSVLSGAGFMKFGKPHIEMRLFKGM